MPWQSRMVWPTLHEKTPPFEPSTWILRILLMVFLRLAHLGVSWMLETSSSPLSLLRLPSSFRASNWVSRETRAVARETATVSSCHRSWSFKMTPQPCSHPS